MCGEQAAADRDVRADGPEPFAACLGDPGGFLELAVAEISDDRLIQRLFFKVLHQQLPRFPFVLESSFFPIDVDFVTVFKLFRPALNDDPALFIFFVPCLPRRHVFLFLVAFLMRQYEKVPFPADPSQGFGENVFILCCAAVYRVAETDTFFTVRAIPFSLLLPQQIPLDLRLGRLLLGIFSDLVGRVSEPLFIFPYLLRNLVALGQSRLHVPRQFDDDLARRSP